MNKPTIEHIDKDTIRVTGTDIDILFQKFNGYIRFNHDIGIMQLTQGDATVLGEALIALSRL